MNQKLIEFNASLRRTDLPELRTGDVVRVTRKIKEGGKERSQVFEGMIIAKKGGQSSSPIITVRKVSFGIGVEIILPLNSPQIETIQFVKRTKAGRSKLYYVRHKSAKVLSRKLKEVSAKSEETSNEKTVSTKKTAKKAKSEKPVESAETATE